MYTHSYMHMHIHIDISIFTNCKGASATKVSKSENLASRRLLARFCVPRRSRNAPKRGPSKLSDFDIDFEALQAASWAFNMAPKSI